MAKPYIPLDWHNVGESLTPYISLIFRGSVTTHEFPSPTNRIYIQNATFNVLNEQGASTASITLADPDFVNLEAFFARAIVEANRSSRTSGYWFCKVWWGWTYYGNQVSFNDGGRGQQKSSGIHTYMLKDLRYDLDDVELKLNLDLIDIGESILGAKQPEDPDLEVGNLAEVDDSGFVNTESKGKTQEDLNIQDLEKELANAYQKDVVDADGNVKNVAGLKNEFGDPSTGSTTSTQEAQQPPPIDNVFKNKGLWDILKWMLETWWKGSNKEGTSLEVIWKESTGAPDNTIVDEYVIPAKTGIRSAVDGILKKMKKEGYQAVSLSGCKTVDGNPVPNMAFGWQPVAPKSPMSEDEAGAIFRKARTYVYRPGGKDDISRGFTMINSLSYEWTSQGWRGLGIPDLYAITMDENGKLHVFKSRADFQSAPSSAKRYEYMNRDGKPVNSESQSGASSIDSSGNTDTISSPPITAIYTTWRAAAENLQGKKEVEVIDTTTGQIKKIGNTSGAYQIDYNYGVMGFGSSPATIDELGKRLIVNVWESFVNEMFNVDITTPGDPWLDNSIWSGAQDSDLLVDLYSAYFKVLIYRPTEVNQNVLSSIITGNYLCLKGCTHTITEGEYTTSLKLIKAW